MHLKIYLKSINNFFFNLPFVFIKYIKRFFIMGFAAFCLLFLFCQKAQSDANTWNNFVTDYRNGISPITLLDNLTAGTSKIGQSGNKRLTIDGDGHFLDSINLTDSQFSLEDSTITFKSIIFQNFYSNGSGGVIRGLRSSLAFTGNVNFKNNYSQYRGGAIFVENYSDLSFINSSITFIYSRANYLQQGTTYWDIGGGGAIDIGEGSRLSFNNSRVYFIDNTASNASGGAILAIGALSISFVNSTAAFINNSASPYAVSYSGGGAIYVNASPISFVNSSAVFINNYTNQAAIGGGAIYVKTSPLSFVNSFIDFTSNTAGVRGGAIGIESSGSNFSITNSVVKFTSNTANVRGGAIYSDSPISIVNSSVSFVGNNASYYGGAVYLKSNSSILDSSVSFIGNNANSGNGGAIYIERINSYTRASLSFSNSQITFRNNMAGNILNDIYLPDANLTILFFIGANTFPNGIRVSGNTASNTQKQGAGTLIFAGDPTIILNNFTIEAGSVIFKTAVSTVGVLNVSPGASLILDNSAQSVEVSSFYVTGNFSLQGVLKINVDLSNAVADWIYVGGSFSVSKSTLSVNSFGDYTAPVKILTSTSALPTTMDLTAPAGIILKTEGNSLFLDFLFWNVFANRFQTAGEGTAVSLPRDSFAISETTPVAIGSPQNNNLIVDGHDHFLDSSGFANFGILLNNKNITFQNILFKGFARSAASSGGNGGALNSQGSILVFSGSITFSSNSAGGAGGAIFSNANSSISFVNSLINFTSNTAVGNGGAVYVEGFSNLSIFGSTINFHANRSLAFGNSGGAVYANSNSTVSFVDALINFTSNTAVLNGGAVSVEGFSNLSIFGSTINFTANAVSNPGGAIYAGGNSSISFINALINFTSNSAGLSGGAIYIAGDAVNSNFFVEDAYIDFVANIADREGAGGGGAIYANSNSNISFIGSTVSFSGNIANAGRGGGGAIYVNVSSISFINSSAAFLANSAANYGGAIYATGNSNISFIGS
ncbi:MAG: hypothetical protein LBC07_01665, partial [Elusimicrobiota bacterium]|nr:hypothetical protein [Elusimicrobiota bacterium]